MTAGPVTRASAVVRTGTVLGTYLHGPLLPKNSWFADWLTATALGRDAAELAPLDDALRGRGARRRPPRRRGLTGEVHQSGGVASAAPSPGIPRDQVQHRPARGAVRLPRSRRAGVRRGDQALPRRRRPRRRQALLEGPRRGDLRARRPVRLRQDDRDADGQPDDRHLRRRHPRRRPQRQGARRRRPAARDRLRDPADRPLPAPHDRRQRRHRPAPAGLGQEAHRGRASRS